MSFMKNIQFDRDFHFRIFATSISNIPIHMHQCKELIVVLKGSLKVKISFNNYSLQEGDFLLINSYETHALSCEEECLVLVLMVDNKQFEGNLFVFDIDFYRSYNNNQVKKIKSLMANLYEGFNNSKGRDLVELTRLLKKITRICDEYFQIQSYQMQERRKTDFGDNITRSERMRRVYESLYNSYNKKYILKDLSGQEYLDKSYMSRLIKSDTGQSLSDSIKIVRIDRAEVLLLGTNMLIESLSKEVGFSSTSSFRKLFKQYFHMTPLEYRKKQRENLYPLAQMNHSVINPNNSELLIHLNKLVEEYDGKNIEQLLWNDLWSSLNYVEFLISELQIEDKFVIVKPNKTINTEFEDKNIVITINISNE